MKYAQPNGQEADFRRVWQRVTAGRETPVQPTDPPYPPDTPDRSQTMQPPANPDRTGPAASSGEAAVLCSLLDTVLRCAALSQGGPERLYCGFVRLRRRLAAALYLHFRRRYAPRCPVQWPTEALERCAQLYRLCLAARQTLQQTHSADPALEPLFRDLEDCFAALTAQAEAYAQRLV